MLRTSDDQILKTAAFMLVLVFAFGLTNLAFAAPPKANLDQLRNGAADSPIDPANWVNGNIGSQTGHYVEGYSIAYRAVLTDIPLATPCTLWVGYDIKHSDKHAIDYLTQYNRINDPLHILVFGHPPETIDPLIGVSGVSATTTTYPIPAPTVNESVDPDGPGPLPAQLQPLSSFNNLPAGERVITLFGGTISNVLWDVGDLPEGDLSASNSEARMRVIFTVNSATAVLAWGGHIGWRGEWGLPGDPQSAGGISGSPYHMRLLDWQPRSIFPNLGNQDRSLSAVAVYLPPPICDVTPVSDTVCVGFDATFTDHSTAGTPPYTWVWTKPPDPTVLSTDSTLTISNATVDDSGQYMVVVEDANGLVDTCYASLTVNDLPLCQITGDTTVCDGFTTEFCALDDPDYEYLWRGPEDDGATTRCITIGTEGTYWVIITDENDCVDSCSRYLTVNDLPLCGITGDTVVCDGFTTEFCATDDPDYTYLWRGPEDDGATTRCITIGTEGLYWVIITDENDCVDSCSRYLTVHDLPSCMLTCPDPPPVCGSRGNILTATTTGDIVTYDWSLSNSGWEITDGQGTDTITYTAGSSGSMGTFKLVVTDVNGCMDSCEITCECNPGEYCTYTQGGWGAPCPESQQDDSLSTQPGCIRDHYFSRVFPEGVIIGDPSGPPSLSGPAGADAHILAARTLSEDPAGPTQAGPRLSAGAAAFVTSEWFAALWTDSAAVERFLPAGGTPGVLTADLVDPDSTPAGVLAGQILALRLNVEYSCQGILTQLGLLPAVGCYGDFVIPDTCGNGKFNGISVYAFLAIADSAVGGLDILGKYGASLSDLNFTATCLNELHDNCGQTYPFALTGSNSDQVGVGTGAKSSDSEEMTLPVEFSVSQNYPNPFNPACEIAYALPADCKVTLCVYNLLGQKVRVLVDEYQSAGYRSVRWDGKDGQGQQLASGLYFYRIEAGEFSEIKKMLLMK